MAFIELTSAASAKTGKIYLDPSKVVTCQPSAEGSLIWINAGSTMIKIACAEGTEAVMKLVNEALKVKT